MKIEGPNRANAAGGARKAQAAADGFSLPASAAPAEAAPAQGVRAAQALDAVLALQIEPDPQRRSRQARRGHTMLDTLESLAAAHLAGEAPHAARLKLQALTMQSEATGDAALDAVLDDIDVRVAVELAKLEMAEKRV
ncbi:MAG: flagellar assembly protein FliX [Hyphomonadaceae bacterium]